MSLLNFNDLKLESLVEILGWMLLHSLWQFAALGIFTAVVLRFMKNRSANERHSVLVMAMALAVAIPVATVSLIIPPTTHNHPASIVSHHHSHSNFELNSTNGIPRGPSQSLNASQASENPIQKFPTQAVETRPIVQTETARPSGIASTVQHWLGWIVGGWFLGVSLCLLRPLLGWKALLRLRGNGISQPSEEVQAIFARLLKQVRVQLPVQLFISKLVNTPLVVGYLRPAILLPASLVTNISIVQLETLLLHELAHIRRHDFLINLAQRFIESFFFYHPAIWWISSRLTQERENCCDDFVVSFGGNRITYGQALLAIAEQNVGGSALALNASDGMLLSRILRLTYPAPNAVTRKENYWSVALRVLVMLMSIFLPLGTYVYFNNSERPASSPAPSSAGSTVVATLDNRIEIEIVGVRDHQANISKEEANRWWSPEGHPLKQPPVHLKDLDGSETLVESTSGLDNIRDLLFRIHGLQKGDSVLVSFEEPQGSKSTFGGTGGLVYTPEDGVWTGMYTANFPKSDVAIVRVGIVSDSHTVEGKIDKAAKKHTPQYISHSDQVYDNLILPLKVEQADDSSVLVLDNQHYKQLSEKGIWNFYAVDSNGVQHRNKIEFSSTDGYRTLTFDLPLSEIQHFEYQLRPITQLVVFSNVSLTPSKKTTVFVDTNASELSFTQETVSDGPVVEILGITEETKDGSVDANQQWWNAQGDRLVKSPLVPIDSQFAQNPPRGTKLICRVRDFDRNGRSEIKFSLTPKYRPNQQLSDFETRDNQALMKWQDTQTLWTKKHDAPTEEDSYYDSIVECTVDPMFNADFATFQLTIGEGEKAPPKYLITFDNVSLKTRTRTKVHSHFQYIGEMPSLDKKYIADLGEGINVEFVGVTKNTRPASEGWKPDGREIGDVGYWPSTIVLHNGNTSASYAENGEHPEPDADAYDFLLKFNGLKTQPSLRILASNGGSSRPILPFSDPYLVRDSAHARKRVPHPRIRNPWPDRLEVALTVQPWGKWLQIDAQGNISNPNILDDAYQTYYEMIHVLGVKPKQDSESRQTLLMNMPSDYQRQFDFEIRGFESDGTKQNVINWSSRGVNKEAHTEWGPFSRDKVLAHFEIRLRPYTHWARFTNFALEPNKAALVKIESGEMLSDQP